MTVDVFAVIQRLIIVVMLLFILIELNDIHKTIDHGFNITIESSQQ